MQWYGIWIVTVSSIPLKPELMYATCATSNYSILWRSLSLWWVTDLCQEGLLMSIKFQDFHAFYFEIDRWPAISERDEERLSSAKLQNYNYFVGCRRKSFFIPHYILLQQTRKENISHAYQNNWENLLETSIPFSFSFFLFLCTSASCLFSCNFTGKLVSQLNNFTAATFSWTICITAINAS